MVGSHSAFAGSRPTDEHRPNATVELPPPGCSLMRPGGVTLVGQRLSQRQSEVTTGLAEAVPGLRMGGVVEDLLGLVDE